MSKVTRQNNLPSGAGVCRFLGLLDAPIAQLDRASDYGSEGSRFNSWWVHHLRKVMSAEGGPF